ncbi:hypothetical protein [Bradyrhizobium sp. 2TAF24]|uniref:hypothetical protein n=1 Tax=Bradyrhizobium sp. 2TAF24 TaxID=3233011 RepID=UPI003F9207AC
MRAVIVLLIVMAAVAMGRSAVAQERRPADPSPFAHVPCSVFDNRPCTPSVCSALESGPCFPDIDYPIGENLQVTVESNPPDKDAARYRMPDHDLDTIGDLFQALRSCWTPPEQDIARAGMQMAVKFSFRRDGALIAPPRLTYATPDAAPETRAAYRQAIDASLSHCAPLSFSKGLGGAIAGRPILVRYVDNRTMEPSDKRP